MRSMSYTTAGEGSCREDTTGFEGVEAEKGRFVVLVVDEQKTSEVYRERAHAATGIFRSHDVGLHKVQ